MVFNLTSILSGVLAFSGPTVADAESRFYASSGLSKAMLAANRSFIGTALTLRSPNDTAEAALYSNRNDFNSITPENAMKWESTQPARGNFTFDQADAHIDWAEEHGYQTHCHTLVWHSQLPSWVSQGGFDNETLIQVMREHIEGVAGRYRGRCTRWDVVNEALDEDGTYRPSVFYNTTGEAFIPIAFRIAHSVDPTAHLFYNDYGLEFNSNKTAGALRILKLVQSYGVPIHGIGLQAHSTSEGTPTSGGSVAPDEATLGEVLKGFTDLDVDVAYTEIDVRFITNGTEVGDAMWREKEEVQAGVYGRVARSCLGNERCVGMTTWGVSDKYSWIPATFRGEGGALMWDEEYQKKPAYWGFLQGIWEGSATNATNGGGSKSRWWKDRGRKGRWWR